MFHLQKICGETKTRFLAEGLLSDSKKPRIEAFATLTHGAQAQNFKVET